jgi:hypothetical protein
MGRVSEVQGLLRNGHDPARPAVATSQAAERLGQSRFHVAELVKSGELPGYGIPADKRTRWYVYLDALPDVRNVTASDAPLLIVELQMIRDRIAVVERMRRESRRELLGAYDAATFASDSKGVGELLRSINDSERRNFAFDDELAGIRQAVTDLLDRLHRGSSP